MLSKFEDFKLQSRDDIEIDRTQSFKYLGVKLDEKWSWKPHIKDLFRTLGHRLVLWAIDWPLMASLTTFRLCRCGMGRSGWCEIRDGTTSGFSDLFC